MFERATLNFEKVCFLSTNYSHSLPKKIREIYIKTAGENDVIYADLFQERVDDIFLTDIKLYYLADQFHPSSDGYAILYQKSGRLFPKPVGNHNIKRGMAEKRTSAHSSHLRSDCI